jgi:hypothetical protein
MDCRVEPGNDQVDRSLQNAEMLSPAGLTRGSISFAILEKRFAVKMDCRVKPGNDC